MARHITQIGAALDAGEVSSLIGCPIHDNGDTADLVLDADAWVDLLTRRRRVGWPLHFYREGAPDA